MAKNNIRSIRFSDKLAGLIEQQAGETFTQKFENLVYRCIWELPEQEKRLANIKEKIRQERERLYRLQKATEQLRRLEDDIKRAQQYIQIVERRAKDIAETTEEQA